MRKIEVLLTNDAEINCKLNSSNKKIKLQIKHY